MQVFFITGGTKEQRGAYITREVAKRNIASYNIHRVYRDPDTPSIGIGDIKRWWKDITLIPTGNALSAGIIESAELLTTEAQNTLLKPLEEPPLSAVIFLESPSTGSILPTILSRCQVIQIKKEDIKKEEQTDAERLLQTLTDPAKKVGEKMVAIDKTLPNKDTAKKICLEMLELAHNNGIKDEYQTYKNLLQKLLRAIQELQSNVSYKLVLDALFLPEIH